MSVSEDRTDSPATARPVHEGAEAIAAASASAGYLALVEG